MADVGHRPLGDSEQLPEIAFMNRVEFVGGPHGGQSEERNTLPEAIAAEGGTYRRSVRCAEDGAMRYVWLGSAEPDRRT